MQSKIFLVLMSNLIFRNSHSKWHFFKGNVPFHRLIRSVSLFILMILFSSNWVLAQETDSISFDPKVDKELVVRDTLVPSDSLIVRDTIVPRDTFPPRDTLLPRKNFRRPKRANNLFKSDSLAIYYYHAQKPDALNKFSDTLIDETFYQYDPSRYDHNNIATLGHMGSATMDLVFSLKPKMGTMIGLNGFDLYVKDVEDVKFFKSQKSFTNLYYSQGNEQNDHIFKGSIGRQFNNGIQLTIEHQRLTHALDDPDQSFNTNAFYPYQATKNTNLLVGLAYEPDDKKYASFLTLAHNEIQAIHHGGIVQDDPTVFDIIRTANALDDRYTVPVNLSEEDNITRYALRELKYSQYYDFVRSGLEEKVNRNFKIGHTISYSIDLFKYSEESPDSNYYDRFYDDERGIRLFLKTRALENYVSLSTAVNEGDKQKSKYELGLRHVFNKMEQEFADSTVQNLFAEGILKTKILDLIELDAKGQIGLLQNIGDYRLDANLGLDLKRFGNLSATLIQQRYAPEVIFQTLILSQAEVWSNSFQKPFESELRFSYTLPAANLEAQFSYFLLDNYLYFDETRFPQQEESVINLVQLKIRKDIDIGLFRMENSVFLQQSTNDNILRLPRWSSIHSIGIQGKLFKKVLLTRLGLDLRLNDTFFANQFFPLLSQFHIQDKRTVDLYPAVDAHLAIKVETFRFFFKLDNITSLISDETFYQTPYYPQKETVLRFGISWQFYDQHSSSKSANRNESNSGTGGRDF